MFISFVFILCGFLPRAHGHESLESVSRGQQCVDSEVSFLQTHIAIEQDPDVEIKHNRTQHVRPHGWMPLHKAEHIATGFAAARRQSTADHQQMEADKKANTRRARHGLHNVSWYYPDFQNSHTYYPEVPLSDGGLPLDQQGGLTITGKSNFEQGNFGKHGTILFLSGQSNTVEPYEQMWDKGLVRIPPDRHYKIVFLQTPRVDKVENKWPWYCERVQKQIPETMTFLSFVLQALSDERGDGKLWLVGKSQGAYIASVMAFFGPQVLEGGFFLANYWIPGEEKNWVDEGQATSPTQTKANQTKVWFYSGSLDIRTPPFGELGADVSNYSIPTEPPEYSELLSNQSNKYGVFPIFKCLLSEWQWNSDNYRFLIKPGYGHSTMPYGLPYVPPTVSPSFDGSEFDAVFQAMSDSSGKVDKTEDVTATISTEPCPF